jgi:hypothetical protein
MNSILKQFVLFLTFLSLFSCTSEPVPVNLPINHPANPQAPETTFILPANPFQSDVSSAAPESNHESKMTHEAHDSHDGSEGSRLDHQMEQKKHESNEMQPSAQEKTGH